MRAQTDGRFINMHGRQRDQRDPLVGMGTLLMGPGCALYLSAATLLAPKQLGRQQGAGVIMLRPSPLSHYFINKSALGPQAN